MTASDDPRPGTRPAFLKAAGAAGILSTALAARAERLTDGHGTARAAADTLVVAGLLTQFQADRLLAGKTDGFVLGQYVILEPLSAGAVGRVYKARHRTMNRLVAVKVLAARLAADPARRQAFRAEARDAARLTHPHLVSVLDSNRVGDRLYVVLEYVDGAGADVLVRRTGPLPGGRASEVVRQAALGLAYAHDRGMAHGALSPAALLVGRAGGGVAAGVEVKVSMACTGRLSGADQADGPCAPADFRAPEHITGGATAAGDVYSLGATFRYLLGGLGEGDGPVVAGLIRRMLAADPAGRPTAARVALELSQLADAAAVDFDLSPSGGGASGGFLTGMAPAPATGLDDTFPWSRVAAGLGDTPAPPTVGVWARLRGRLRG